MKFNWSDQISCDRCEKHLGWLLDQDAPASFSIICDDCVAKDPQMEAPTREEIKAAFEASRAVMLRK